MRRWCVFHVQQEVGAAGWRREAMVYEEEGEPGAECEVHGRRGTQCGGWFNEWAVPQSAR